MRNNRGNFTLDQVIAEGRTVYVKNKDGTKSALTQRWTKGQQQVLEAFNEEGVFKTEEEQEGEIEGVPLREVAQGSLEREARGALRRRERLEAPEERIRQPEIRKIKVRSGNPYRTKSGRFARKP